MPMTEVRIVDDDGHDVKPGEPGEAWVRSPMVFKGYINQRKRTTKALSNDGWFRTGDIMRLDPESELFYFIDRKKDVIKTGGENVFALEIERVLQKHPAIRECAIVGIPDVRFGEAIGAAIVLEPGQEITGDELVEFCREKLPSFKKPRHMAIMEELPVNPIGKVQKTILRDKADQLFKPIV